MPFGFLAVFNSFRGFGKIDNVEFGTDCGGFDTYCQLVE